MAAKSDEQKVPSHTLRRLLDCIEKEILPKTREGVEAGNKVFGAAILRRNANLSTVVVGTNRECECPLYHGEVWTIMQWSEQNNASTTRTKAADCIFLSTHEPCCMCISAIVWAGFNQVYYLFPYEKTKEQGIPHDLDIMKELWQVQRYNPANKFCSTTGLVDIIRHCNNQYEKDQLLETVSRITRAYDVLSAKYHNAKVSSTLAFA